MIGVLADGRMGNQMFQYAFAFASSKKLKVPFFVFKHKHLHYFQLSHNFEVTNNRNVKEYFYKNIFKSGFHKFTLSELKVWGVYKNVVQWNNVLEGNQYLLKDIKDNHFYKGYFQSEDYFKEYRADLDQLFTIKEGLKKIFIKEKQYLFNKPYAAIHIRRGDYVNYGGNELGGFDMTLPETYYKNCLSKLSSNLNVVFVSDDIEFAKKTFGINTNYYFEQNDEITDFQILLNAQELVIANSSFSWWAAWLNRQNNKVVYAPKYYLGFKVNKYYPAGINVNDWNWIDVNE